ncbi:MULTISPECIES: hypothetical protein [Clostridium]|uniref:hypothetical protein n=1 Tax=Clostridium TaxID=1485 RepID=UPI00090C82E6|nr:MULTISPECIES: hypothetical protein [Clostridium]APF25318.1 hypothetical protein NPD7_4078 [Clostridium sporogenes]MDI6918929.1 hypothetical protein [Clostridium botulinum]WMU99549.1 hypothetical protein QA656_19665 [Clostridium botulinum]
MLGIIISAVLILLAVAIVMGTWLLIKNDAKSKSQQRKTELYSKNKHMIQNKLSKRKKYDNYLNSLKEKSKNAIRIVKKNDDLIFLGEYREEYPETHIIEIYEDHDKTVYKLDKKLPSEIAQNKAYKFILFTSRLVIVSITISIFLKEPMQAFVFKYIKVITISMIVLAIMFFPLSLQDDYEDSEDQKIIKSDCDECTFIKGCLNCKYVLYKDTSKHVAGCNRHKCYCLDCLKLNNKSIYHVTYLSKFDEYELKKLSNRRYILNGSILSVGEDKYDIAGYCDKSDVAQLNIELEQNKIKKIIPLNDKHYTHIILNSADYYFGVVIM